MRASKNGRTDVATNFQFFAAVYRRHLQAVNGTVFGVQDIAAFPDVFTICLLGCANNFHPQLELVFALVFAKSAFFARLGIGVENALDLATDEQIGRYVGGLNFDRDEVFGIFNRDLKLIALAHLAFPDAGAAAQQAAEFGGSVVTKARGRGYGGRLFQHAMLHARNRGFGMLFIHALSENTAMLRIARRAGAKVERAGSESDAYLQLPNDTLASQLEQWVGAGAAEIDYRFKQQARMLDSVIEAIDKVKTGINTTGSSAAKD